MTQDTSRLVMGRYDADDEPNDDSDLCAECGHQVKPQGCWNGDCFVYCDCYIH